MPPKKDRGTRTETLSLRLDPKTKFILEFVSRVNGQTLTTVVDRAIRKSCDEVKIESRFGDNSYKWSDFWDPDDGVRTLRLLACGGYPTTFDEDELLNFTKMHWDFFYADREDDRPHRSYVQILWPKIDKYIQLWREQRDSDYWAAGKAMYADLLAAKVVPPTWPRNKSAMVEVFGPDPAIDKAPW
jgi:hypothetical protein